MCFPSSVQAGGEGTTHETQSSELYVIRRSVNILGVWSLLILLALSCSPPSGAQQSKNESLSSWNDGPAKQAIIDFIARVTTQGSRDFVPVAQRIATLDNDGTLCCEQPIYVHPTSIR